MMDWYILIDQIGSAFSLWYVSFLWYSLLVFVGLSLVLFAYRKISARVKCLIWMAAIPMMLVMPSLSKLAPNDKIPVYNIVVSGIDIPESNQPVIASETDTDTVKSNTFDFTTPFTPFITLYILSAITMVVFFFAGRRKIYRIVLRSTPILDTPFLDLFDGCLRKMNISRNVQVLESAETTVPFTINLFHPVIVLPSGLSANISHEENRHVLFHELAHIKRFDSPLLVVAAIGRVLFFLNPFIWFAVSRITSLTEEACDEHVVEYCSEPVHYARTLTSIAETIKNTSIGLEYVAGFVFSRHVFHKRIQSILSMRNNTVMKLSRSMALGLVILMGFLTASIITFPVTIGATDWSSAKSPIDKLEKLMKKASTAEKREAIYAMQEAFNKYDRHYDVMKCADLILKADRNVTLIGSIAEYAISTPYHTGAFIEIAKYASKAKVADDEFLELAEMAQKYGSGTSNIIKLAKQASRARDEEKLAEIKIEIKELDSKLASVPRGIINKTDNKSPSYMTLDELEKKMAQADTPEKREAIKNIRNLLKKYKRHFSATRCVDMILETDRNVKIIEEIAEYAIKTKYHTIAFIRVAEYASQAPVADDEFIVLAKRIKKPWGTGKVLEQAKLAAEAQNEAELKAVMQKKKK